MNDTNLATAVARCVGSVLGHAEVSSADSLRDLGMTSVQAVRLRGALRETSGAALPLRTLFEVETVGELVDCLASATPSSPRARRSPTTVAVDDRAVTFQQQQFWMYHQTAGLPYLYNDGLVANIVGGVDFGAMEVALRHVTHQHPPLRTTVRLHEGRLMSSTLSASNLVVERLTADQGEFGGLIEEFLARPFQIEKEVSSRALLLDDARGAAVLVWGIHHIAIDGTALPTLIRDLTSAYAHAADGAAEQPQVDDRYAAYAQWQKSANLEQDVDWWIDRLGEQTPRNAERRPGSIAHGTARRTTALVPTDVALQLKGTAARLGVSAFACTAAALVRALPECPTAVGIPVANRTRAEDADAVGAYVNTVGLKLPPSDTGTWSGYVTALSAELTDALEHQAVPWLMIVRKAMSQGVHIPAIEVLVSEQSSFDGLPAFRGTRTEWQGDISGRLGVGLAPIEAMTHWTAGQLHLTLSTLPGHVSAHAASAILSDWRAGIELIAEEVL